MNTSKQISTPPGKAGRQHLDEFRKLSLKVIEQRKKIKKHDKRIKKKQLDTTIKL